MYFYLVEQCMLYRDHYSCTIKLVCGVFAVWLVQALRMWKDGETGSKRGSLPQPQCQEPQSYALLRYNPYSN